MSRRRNRSNGHHPLGPPHDLHVMGFVFVRPEHRTPNPASTVTVWGPPNDPETLNQVHYQESCGLEPGALILVFRSRLEVELRPEWREVSWFIEYIGELTKEIARTGPEQFFGAMFQASAPVSAS